MKISTTHQEFADYLRNQRVIEHPDEFLGPNWKDVLNFWFFLDTLTIEQMKIINDAFYSLSSDEHQLAHDAAWVAARAAVGYAAYNAAWVAARAAVSYAAANAAWDDCVTASYAAGYATWEIMGSHILKEQGKSLFFLPMFLNP